MRNSWKGWPALAAAIFGLVLVSPSGRAADTPLAGNWKVITVSDGREIALLIIKVEDKDGKPQVKVLASSSDKDTALENVSVDTHSVRFTFKVRGMPLQMVGYVPQGEERPRKLLGSVHSPQNVEPLILERTDETDIGKANVKKSPGFDELERLRAEKDAKKQEDGLNELLKKHAGKPVVLTATETIVQIAAMSGAGEKKVRSLADQYFKAAAVYGPELERNAALKLARRLLTCEKGAALALEYARKAEKQLAPTDTVAQEAAALKVLAEALIKADETKAENARIAQQEERLDKEFEKNAIPFKLEPPARRRRTSKRVVLVELFTGAQCPPCVAADIAFDAVLKTYKTSEVALLQYHLHIPGPDPLTNADSEAREEYYGKDIPGTPTTFLDGKVTDGLGGGKNGSKESYDTLTKLLDDAMKKNAGASINLDVRRTGDKIDIEAEVDDLVKMGDKVRLHFVLVEEVVRYPGRNRQRLHHHVVRSFPGGVAGFALLDTPAKKKASVNIADLRRVLDNYLKNSAKEQPFSDDHRPLNLKHLKVIAFVQDDKNKEVFQAVQMDVPEAK